MEGKTGACVVEKPKENPEQLTYATTVARLHCLKTDTDIVTLTLNSKINKIQNK